MNKTKTWIIGLTLAALMMAGVAVLAGNGFGVGSSDRLQQTNPADTCTCDQDDDGDGILNSEDTDWIRSLDGTGAGNSHRQGLSISRPLDGTGYGATRAGGLTRGTCSGSCDGSCI